MNVTIITENHFHRTPDDCLYTSTGGDYQFWQRYLAIFDSVRIVARVRDVARPMPNSKNVNGPGVNVAPIPDYLGPWEYLRHSLEVRRTVQNSVAPCDAILMRVPSQLANCLFPMLKKSSRPYGLEVVGDPWEVFAPGVVRHFFRPYFRYHFTSHLKEQCSKACAVAYVTNHTLQQRYPAASKIFKTSYSSIVLPNEALKTFSTEISDVELHPTNIVQMPRTFNFAKTEIRLILVGSLAQLYKGPDIAIDAMTICVQNGLNVFLTIVGDGIYRSQLEKQATRLGLEKRVLFRGELPSGKAVLNELDHNHLFIMPSRTEGLPRAMIEAMARGLPCIGSKVGGIPELLDTEDMFQPNDAQALAAKIHEISLNPNRVHDMSIRNLRRAMDFHEDKLRSRRLEFYSYVRNTTEKWLKHRKAA